MCRQVLIEEQQLAREMVQSFEEKIAELLRQVQTREELLSGKKAKIIGQEANTRTYHATFNQVEQDMLKKAVIRELQLELEGQSNERIRLKRELAAQAKLICDLQTKLKGVGRGSGCTADNPLKTQLVLFEDEERQSSRHSNSEEFQSLELSDSFHVQHQEVLSKPTIYTSRVVEALHSYQLRMLLYKKTMGEASLLHENGILKKCLEEMKHSYSAMAGANVQKDRTVARLAAENRRYRHILVTGQ